jgi:lysophospholipase L1-like esterase
VVIRRMAVLVIASLLSAPACTSAPVPNPLPPPCPYPDSAVQFNGDSLGIHLSRFLDLAAGVTLVNVSEARSGFTYDLPADDVRNLPAVDRIATTVQSWIDRCGVPALVIVQGGVNDLAGARRSAEQVSTAVRELSDWLRDRDIPTLWVAMHPFARAGNYMWADPARRAFNTWLGSGEVWGRVVDCTPQLEDPLVPGTLDPRFYEIVDLFGSVDGVHPNMDGYRVFARCISAAV